MTAAEVWAMKWIHFAVLAFGVLLGCGGSSQMPEEGQGGSPPFGTGGAQGQGGAVAPGAGGSQGGACVAPGGVCPNANECCAGETCVATSSGNVCASNCTTSGQCQSGCCAPLQGGSVAVCSPAQYCPPPGTC